SSAIRIVRSGFMSQPSTVRLWRWWWNDEMERCALVDLGLGPDTSAMPHQHTAHAGQTDAGTRIVAGLVQPLEHTKQLARILHVETGPVVAHGELMAAVGQCPRRHLDHRFF